MIVELVAVATTAFYAVNIPMKLAFRLRLQENGSDMATGASLFEGRFALRAAGKRLDGQKSRRKWDSPNFARKKIPAMLRATKAAGYAMRHLRLDFLAVRGEIGLSDAMHTALLCGAIAAVGQSARAAMGNRVRLSLRPDFSRSHVSGEICGIVSASVGHIILAAIYGAIEYGNGRLSQWTHTRLKTS